MSSMLAAVTADSPVKVNLTIMKPDGQTRIPFCYETTVGEIGIDMSAIHGASEGFDDEPYRVRINEATQAGDTDAVLSISQEWAQDKNEWAVAGGLTPSDLFDQAIYDSLFESAEAQRVGLTKADSGNNPFFSISSMIVEISGPSTNGATVFVSGTSHFGA